MGFRHVSVCQAASHLSLLTVLRRHPGIGALILSWDVTFMSIFVASHCSGPNLVLDSKLEEHCLGGSQSARPPRIIISGASYAPPSKFPVLKYQFLQNSVVFCVSISSSWVLVARRNVLQKQRNKGFGAVGARFSIPEVEGGSWLVIGFLFAVAFLHGLGPLGGKQNVLRKRALWNPSLLYS